MNEQTNKKERKKSRERSIDINNELLVWFKYEYEGM